MGRDFLQMNEFLKHPIFFLSLDDENLNWRNLSTPGHRLGWGVELGRTDLEVV